MRISGILALFGLGTFILQTGWVPGANATDCSDYNYSIQFQWAQLPNSGGKWGYVSKLLPRDPQRNARYRAAIKELQEHFKQTNDRSYAPNDKAWGGTLPNTLGVGYSEDVGFGSAGSPVQNSALAAGSKICDLDKKITDGNVNPGLKCDAHIYWEMIYPNGSKEEADKLTVADCVYANPAVGGGGGRGTSRPAGASAPAP
jgi:hypothetical protein